MSNQDSLSFLKKMALYVLLGSSILYALYRFALSILYFNHKYAGELPTVPSIIIFGFVGTGALILFLLILKCIIKEEDVTALFIPTFILFSLLYLIAFPPLTVPDELAHFSSAYRLSNLVLIPGKQLDSSNLLLRNDDYNAIYNYYHNYLSSANYAALLEHFSLFTKESGYSAANLPNTISAAPLGYVFSALGIFFARLLHLGSFPLFYLGRVCNIAAFCAITYTAIKRIPYGKPILFVIAFLPMTLHLAASYSYDGFAISTSLLFFSNILYWNASSEQMTKKDRIIAAALALPICLTKIVYIPLCLLLLIIPNCIVFRNRRQAILYKIFSIIGIFVIFLLVYLSSAFQSLSSDELGYIDASSYTISWVLHNIPATILIFLRTLELDFGFHLASMIGGSLGWFQINLSQLQIDLLFIFLGISICITASSDCSPSAYSKIFLSVIIFLSCGLVMASMFFGWTPFGSETIEGIQGRYFLPLLFPLCIVLKNRILIFDATYQYGYFSVFLTFCFYCFLQIFMLGYTII